MKEFVPKAKSKVFTREFFSKYIYIFLVGLCLLLGVSYSLTFFVQNKNIATGSITTGNLTINVSDKSINASNLRVPATDQEGLSLYSKVLTLTNTSNVDGKVKLSLTRTSGLNLTNLRYAIIINGAIQEIGDVGAEGELFTTAIMAGEDPITVEIRLWPKTTYTRDETNFNGSIKVDINYLGQRAPALSNPAGKYVSFNCDGNNCEIWQIVKVENGRLVLTKQANYSGATSRTDSGLYKPDSFNPAITFNDDSLITSLSTDGLNVYLAKTTKINGGSGTQADPYTLINNDFSEQDKKKVATITYKDSDGTTTLGTQSIYYGETNYISQMISGPAFINWSDGNNTYNLGDIVSFISNIDLIAVLRGEATMSLSSSSGTIDVGETAEVEVTTNGDGILTCKSSNSSYATCSFDDNTLIVTGVAFGSATITVSQSIGAEYLAPEDVTYAVTVAPGSLAYNVMETVIASKSNVTTAADAEGTVFLKGTEDTINFNYVWYSGKLWRVTALYSNGTMKLVTENSMTAIYWGNSVTFNSSYVDQWLSQEYLPTLYNHSNIIVSNGEWNVTMTAETTDPYQLVNSTTIDRTVGLLNAYEYMQTKPESGSSYLRNGQFFWLMNPYSNSFVGRIHSEGGVQYDNPSSYANAVRPAVYLRADARFLDGGDGTRANPYRVFGDKDVASANELINTRLSGEYVSINSELYRIVGIENNTTKIVKTDYVTNPNSSNSDKKLGYYGSDIYYHTSSSDLSYWDKYLTDTTNGWLSSENAPNTNLLASGTYYEGPYSSGGTYKTTICATYDNDTSTSSCTKISDENELYTGYVGLLRAGEMHAAQQSTTTHNINDSLYKNMLIISTHAGQYIRFITSNGAVGSNGPSSNARAVRPALYLNASVKVVSGSGTANSPYVIGL